MGKDLFIKYYKLVQMVIELIVDIWKKNDSQTVLDCLHVIFDIISTVSDIEPSYCLGTLLRYIDNQMMDVALRSTILSSKLGDDCLIAALHRMVDWARWPAAGTVDVWVVKFLRGLASVHRYTILMNVTENKVTQLFLTLRIPPIRKVNLKILVHLLLGYQHSPEPFHKVLPHANEMISDLMKENTPGSKFVLDQLADLLYCLMYHHAGFPDLYDPVLEALKSVTPPSDSEIKKKLAECKWGTQKLEGVVTTYTAHLKKSETGKTGLHNLGNSCYMNSVIQALFMCDSFRHMVLIHPISTEQTFMAKLQYVFAFLSLTQRPAYAPVNFLDISRPPWFTHGCQQDCSEFFKYLLVQLQEQETAAMKRKLSFSQQDGDGDTTPKERKIDPLSTLVGQTFCGKMKITVTCLNCKTQSSNTEDFLDLSLAFPEYKVSSQKTLAGGSAKTSEEAMSDVADSSSSVTNIMTLNDLLRYYFQPESLVEDNQYHCDKCNGLQDGQRRQEVVGNPEYLIFTLMRFSYDAQLKARTKIFNEVKYPKTLILPVHRNTLFTQNILRKCGSKNLCNFVESQICKQGCDPLSCDVELYGLCSVIVHSGTSSDCGHYYCYARHSIHKPLTSISDEDLSEDTIDFLQDRWYLFNDSRVSYADYQSFSSVTQRFTKDTAYVLFYKRIDMHRDDYKVDLNESISPRRVDPPLRADLRAHVNKDNRLYLQEQEVAAKKKCTKQLPSSPWNWQYKDDDDNGPPGSCGGGGGLGSLDTSGSKFVF
ncbi:hypothetical protein ScPMuIL_009937 [Solemya velum]